MSSVDSDIDCPNCSFEEANESWNSRGYTHTFCGQCGYCRVQDYVKGTDEITGGVGSFRMTFENHVSSLGGIKSAKSLGELKRDFRRAMRNLAVKRLEFTLKINGEWQKVVVKDYPMPGPKKIPKGAAKAAKAAKHSSRLRGASEPKELQFEEMSEDIPF